MRRSELEHIIRASGDIAQDDEIVIIGSQAVLGQFPDAPVRLLTSMETDVYPRNKPALADKVDGAIGEGSPFHEEFGYYAQGVGPETAVLPSGWQDRLVSIRNENTKGITGLCLEVHDLAISKLVAGRHKDFEFVQELVRNRMVQYKILIERLAATDLMKQERNRIRTRIDALFDVGGGGGEKN
jgi:hypothetical protein